jgi:hypothetical protein
MRLTDQATVAGSVCPQVDAPSMPSEGAHLPDALRVFAIGPNRHHAVAANADLPALVPSARNIWTTTSVKSAPPPRGATR